MKFDEERVAYSVLTVMLGMAIPFTNGSPVPRHSQQAQQSQSQDVQDIEERSPGLVIPTPEASVKFGLAGATEFYRGYSAGWVVGDGDGGRQKKIRNGEPRQGLAARIVMAASSHFTQLTPTE